MTAKMERSTHCTENALANWVEKIPTTQACLNSVLNVVVVVAAAAVVDGGECGGVGVPAIGYVTVGIALRSDGRENTSAGEWHKKKQQEGASRPMTLLSKADESYRNHH